MKQGDDEVLGLESHIQSKNIPSQTIRKTFQVSHPFTPQHFSHLLCRTHYHKPTCVLSRLSWSPRWIRIAEGQGKGAWCRIKRRTPVSISETFNWDWYTASLSGDCKALRWKSKSSIKGNKQSSIVCGKDVNAVQIQRVVIFWNLRRDGSEIDKRELERLSNALGGEGECFLDHWINPHAQLVDASTIILRKTVGSHCFRGWRVGGRVRRARVGKQPTRNETSSSSCLACQSKLLHFL